MSRILCIIQPNVASCSALECSSCLENIKEHPPPTMTRANYRPKHYTVCSDQMNGEYSAPSVLPTLSGALHKWADRRGLFLTKHCSGSSLRVMQMVQRSLGPPVHRCGVLSLARDCVPPPFDEGMR